MGNTLFLGIDVGSVSVKLAVVDDQAQVLHEAYTRIKADPLLVLAAELRAIEEQIPAQDVLAAGITGSGGKQAAAALGARFINEILAQAVFAERFHPGARTIIEMGGEDAKLINLAREKGGKVKIEDFSMNTVCAAGTGSFLDQQAHRLHLSIEEFSEVALRSKTPPAVAGRCSVFAKSDMIHLQQIATPDYDIVAGLCFAMARNFKATVGKGRKFPAPLLFLGGVAANLGMRRAFQEVLGLTEGDLAVPAHFNTSGAVGAALMVMQQREAGIPYRGAAELQAALSVPEKTLRSSARPLSAPEHIMPNPEQDAAPGSGERSDAYLGVDVGSVSTNVVVIDADGRVLSKRYLPTAGRPIEAVKQGLAGVGEEIGRRVTIRGAGATGSGRYLTGDMIGADVVRNEITAQATAAAAIDPSVDTIFEIGGQDSKYISLRDGAIVDFEMNKACAAGTGSFLEEQAERLGIRIKEEFAGRALCSVSPCGLGERCTVFMESDLVHYLNKGASTDDLTAGLAYSIAHNYLNKVVAGKRVGERIFFQGGVAANQAVVSAFETVTGKPVTVPPHHEVTGAIGAAILARDEMQRHPGRTSAFKGFDLSKRAYAVTTFQCRECSNRCDIRRVIFDGEQPLFYGSRCEKYDVKRTAAPSEALPDLFAERERLLTAAPPAGSEETPRPSIGVPRTLFLHDYLPFWRTFFTELGFRVVLSERTNRTLVNKGLEAAAAESCFPAKVALGHLQDLIDKQVDTIFLPSFIRFPSLLEKAGGTQACPYVQALPYVARASLSFGATRTVEPKLFLHGRRHVRASIKALAAMLGKSARAAFAALRHAERAQNEFHRALAEQGRQALAGLGKKTALVLLGRSYNTADTGMNMNLPAKIRDLGVQAVPLDFLPQHGSHLSGWEDMYWRSGQRILSAARFIKEHPNLHLVYLTNFGCGPDSFITHFFQHEMAGRPFLQLEVDEHSADAGAITRIEAFLDSLRHTDGTVPPRAASLPRARAALRRRIYVPPMTDHAQVLAAAFRACGAEAEVLPESDEETRRIGKEHSSGRECYPLALTVGDMIKAVRRPDFDPDKSAFFMPTGKGPCRFGQYHLYHRQVLDRLGLGSVPIFSPMQDETLHRDVQGLDKHFIRMTWQGALAVDILEKTVREYRPYEQQEGRADRIYEAALGRIVAAIENRADLLPVLREAYEEFSSLKISERNKPVIGVVGEIYVRSNRFSNENIVRQIERLGGEAWVAPISEWLLYVTATSKVSARMNRAWKSLLKSHLTERVQHRDERLFLGCFNGNLRSLHEPTIRQTLQAAHPYIHHSFEGEAVLSVGKAIDYISKGVSGIVNVMPLSCMPGTIAGAVLKRVREDHGNIPLLTIAYEGQKDSQTLTRLEAFMHQARGHRLSGDS